MVKSNRKYTITNWREWSQAMFKIEGANHFSDPIGTISAENIGPGITRVEAKFDLIPAAAPTTSKTPPNISKDEDIPF